MFGDLLAKGKKAEGEQDSSSSEARAAAAAAGSSGKPIDAVLESIRADYAEDYFISGKGEMAGNNCCCRPWMHVTTCIAAAGPQQVGSAAALGLRCCIQFRSALLLVLMILQLQFLQKDIHKSLAQQTLLLFLPGFVLLQTMIQSACLQTR